MDLIEQKKSSIKVYVRIRPLLKHEQGQEEIISPDPDLKHINIDNSTSMTYRQAFDYVMGPEQTQKDVYKQISPGIAQLAQGFNTTVLAYGQTGSGKTHTMFGSDWEYLATNPQVYELTEELKVQHQATFIEDLQTDINNAGVIPRSIYQLFNMVESQGFYIYCSFLQVYNERIYDLLTDHQVPKPLTIHESKIDGIYVEGLTEYAVNHYYDCLTLMKRGEKNRYIRHTSMNMKSSRSHTIFQIIIESNKADHRGRLKKCKLNLCDLAGSEKIIKGEVMKQAHLQELKSINLSLTTLGKVIHSLSQNSKKGNSLPIPYRESKLTRLLQDSLGGNTYTYIVANVASGVNNIDETYSTLKFAERAKNVPLTVCANKIIATDQELLKKLMREIEYLKNMLNMKRKGLNANDIHFKMIKIQEENDRLRQGTISVEQVEGLIKENRNMKIELQKRAQAMTLGSGDALSGDQDFSPRQRPNMGDIEDRLEKSMILNNSEQNSSAQIINEFTRASRSKLNNNQIQIFTDSSPYSLKKDTGGFGRKLYNNEFIPATQQNSDFGSSTYTANQSYQQGKRDNSQQGASLRNFQKNGMMIISSSVMPITEVQVRIRGKGNKIQTSYGQIEQSDQKYQKSKQIGIQSKRVIERLNLLDSFQTNNNIRLQQDVESIQQQRSLTGPINNAYRVLQQSPVKYPNKDIKRQGNGQINYQHKLMIIEKSLIQL